MKTAMQELIDKIDEISNLDYYVQVLILRGFAQKLLEKEKQHIIDAWTDASPWGEERSGEQYYNETFKKD